jgi:hypothetical protein
VKTVLPSGSRPATLLALVLLSSGASAQTPRPDAGASAASSGATSLLRLRFAAGQRLRYAIRSTQNAQGLASTTSQTLEIQTVRVEPDGSATQTARTTAFRMESGALPPAQRASLEQAMSAAVFEYRVDPRGRVVSRAPVAGLARSLAELGDQVWQTVEGSIPALPEGPIAAGASWSESRQVRFALGASRLAMQLNLTYTLREVRRTPQGPVAAIGVAVNATVTQGAGAPNVTVSGVGRGDGTVAFLVDRGVLQRATSSLQLDITITSRGTQRQSLRMSANSEMTLQ